MTVQITVSGPRPRVTVSGPVERVVIGPRRVPVTVSMAGVQGPQGPSGGGVFAYSGSAYVIDGTARIFVQRTGDPDPAGLVANDIVLKES